MASRKIFLAVALLALFLFTAVNADFGKYSYNVIFC